MNEATDATTQINEHTPSEYDNMDKYAASSQSFPLKDKNVSGGGSLPKDKKTEIHSNKTQRKATVTHIRIQGTEAG